ncbi:hypothetical protein PG994_006890 [Apiospora phragmitis]|uniref:Uncharacterized protein n=1 Tax=Apiospora phragmitis TaxID=2905665 RepID=A0ABR1VGA4_9PEZI
MVVNRGGGRQGGGWPNVKRIYSSGYIDTDGTETPEVEFRLPEPASSTVESLLHHDHLDVLLQAPRALQVFRNWVHIRTESLQRSLEHQKDTLKEISITQNYSNFGPDSQDEDVKPMSFAAFTKLQVLEISLPFVFGEDVVCLAEGTARRQEDAGDPSDSEQSECATRVREMLPASIETVRAEQFPGLRTIEVHVCETFELEYEGIVSGDQLEKSFRATRAAGLNMEFIDGSNPERDDADELEDYPYDVEDIKIDSGDSGESEVPLGHEIHAIR